MQNELHQDVIHKLITSYPAYFDVSTLKELNGIALYANLWKT